VWYGMGRARAVPLAVHCFDCFAAALPLTGGLSSSLPSSHALSSLIISIVIIIVVGFYCCLMVLLCASSLFVCADMRAVLPFRSVSVACIVVCRVLL
jgi:hypothetical protein